MTTPAVTTPVAKTPAVTTPVAKTPAVTTPVATRRSGVLGPGADAAARFLSDLVVGTGWRPDGLYIATSDAGAHESIEFWRAAGETGLRFANPRGFPWTLANSPTGHLARTLGVRGPIYTFVGGREARDAAIEQARDDLEAGLVTQALVTVHGHEADGWFHAEATLLR